MSRAVTVRWARPGDAAEVAEVHLASWREAYRRLLPSELLAGLRLADRERLWRERLGDQTAGEGPRVPTLIAAEGGGRIAGFATLAMPSRDPDEAEDVAEIPALYLRPDVRREGIGSTLVEAAIRELRERGFREAILWMLKGNQPADAFYRATGWRADGGARKSQYFPDVEALVELRFRRRL